jgi:MscS family membrane protein
VALAAQDTVKHFFGSIMIFVDRPFQIGDWIEVDGLNGTVEEVGIRSTRIRTFANSLVSFPNGQLADSVINNWGLRVYRRYSTKVGLTYDTPPDLLELYIEGMKGLVLNHPLTRKDYYEIHLNEFGPSSLDILVYVFFEADSWSAELKARHELMIGFIKLAEVLGVSFAFPSQTLYLENMPGQEKSGFNTNLEEVNPKMQAFLDTFEKRHQNQQGTDDRIKPIGGE